MASAKKPDTESSVNSARLASLLDKLVAVHLDLDLLCGKHAARQRVAATPQAIAEACDVLQSAIADLRNIICQLDGVTTPRGTTSHS
jgi:signal transduction histidine kinase